jgi:hypothetical protein
MRPFLIALMVLGPAILAGCASPGGAQNPEFTLNRQVRFHVDNGNVETKDDPYKFLSSTFIVRIGNAAVTPSAVSIVYQDRTGANVTKALSSFTDKASLAPGDEVRIEDANITSDAALVRDGATVVSRARAPEAWWVSEGYPIGFEMDPGSALGYKLTSEASETFALSNIKMKGEGAPTLNSLTGKVGAVFSGTVDLAYAKDLADVQAHTMQSARAMTWKTAGTMGIPVVLEASMAVPDKGTVAGGIESLPATSVSFDASGRVYWNASGAAVRTEVDGGNATTKLDVVGWQTGENPFGDFSCAGKARSDQCRLTEVPDNGKEKTTPLPSSSQNLDEFPWNVAPEVVANLTRFLAEDIVPGDEFRFDVDVTLEGLKDYRPADGAPKHTRIAGGASMKATSFEDVTVAAGTFNALKIVERVDFLLDVGEALDATGAQTFKPFHTEQKVVETTFWLERDTFTPLRIQQTVPLQMGEVVDALLRSVGDKGWTQAQIDPLGPNNVDLTIEGKVDLELAKKTGTSRFSPWLVLAGFHAFTAIPGLAGASAAQGALGATPWTGARQEAAYPTSPPYPTPSTPPYDYGDGSSAKSLAVTSAGPIAGNVKEYTIASASAHLSWFELGLQLDGAYLDYGSGDGTWCVVSADTGDCDMDAAFADVAEGDTLRIQAADLSGKTLRVLDMQSESVILTVTVS